MGKVWYILEKDGKQETLEFTPGFFGAVKIEGKLMEYDREGWMIVGIDGDNPYEVKRIADEMRHQQAKGEEKALKDVKEDLDKVKEFREGSKGHRKLLKFREMLEGKKK